MDEITILIPSFNRRKFLPLIIKNLKSQTYPHNLLNVIIDDDGEEKLISSDQELKLIKDYIAPIKLKYINDRKWRDIGIKRNQLVKDATTDIVCWMDSDDIYFPSYISHSHQELKKIMKKKRGCVGSNKMIFINCKDPEYTLYGLDCLDNKVMCHEATLMFTKKWFQASCKFATSGVGEGKNLIKGSETNTALTDINKIMACLCHSENTVNKDFFMNNKRKLDTKITPEFKKILDSIFEKN